MPLLCMTCGALTQANTHVMRMQSELVSSIKCNTEVVDCDYLRCLPIIVGSEEVQHMRATDKTHMVHTHHC